jgi:hypothetical protein
MHTLKKYAQESDVIVEMGVRWVVSTYAFAVSKPKKFISIDLYHPSHWGLEYGERLTDIQEYCKNNNTEYSFIQKNTLDVDIPETDLLFIDTLHAYGQLKEELKKHANKVKKYIIFHDTTSYENQDEPASINEPKIGEVSNLLEKHKSGLWPAIEEFLSENKNWSVFERYTNNNGLTILKRY